VIGDTVAAFGGGGEQIERMVTVFGQIRASGRLLGQDLLQLEQQGIPVIDILAKKLAKYGVTRAMLSRPGALQIPAEIGIPALLAGMQERFKGASKLQARTLIGQLSTSTIRSRRSWKFGSFERRARDYWPSLNERWPDELDQKQHGKISVARPGAWRRTILRASHSS
jgi:tape measure domain-containing protein